MDNNVEKFCSVLQSDLNGSKITDFLLHIPDIFKIIFFDSGYKKALGETYL